ncbi:MAG: SHOCT domain-containing protein [Isosphaeraceae bacterium]
MMWPYYNDGFSWLWMGGMMVAFWTAVILLAIWAFRSVGRQKNESDPALATLRNRLASGAISQDEYEKTKKLLQ